MSQVLLALSRASVLIFALGMAGTALASDSAQFCGRNHGSQFLCERDSRCHYSDEIRKCVAYDVDCSSRRNDEWSCQATAGCLWDHRWQDCADDPRVGNGGGHDRRCQDYNYDPRACQDAWGCEWDSWSRTCVDQGGVDPYPGQQCSRYDQNPRQCERTPGCRYDDWSRQCERDGGGHPGGSRVVIPCSSHNSAMQTCHVGGTVFSARLLRNTGTYRCVEGSTWGRSTTGIWVKGGCSGDFELFVRRQ